MDKYTTIELKVPVGSEQEVKELVHNYIVGNYLPNRIKVIPPEKEQEYKDEADAYLVANNKPVRFAVVKEVDLQNEEIVL